MAVRRNRVRLTAEQRRRLAESRRREQRDALNATFGALPNLVVPSRGDWETTPPS